MRRPLLTMIAATVAIFSTAATATAAVGIADREADPVVLTGADVPDLIGVDPGKVVAFRYDDGWKQIPVQVDERKMVDYANVRNGFQTGGRPFSNLAYADAGTRAGADPDPTVDDDDEIAMMAKDSGDDASDVAAPAGVVRATRTSVAITDPLDSDTTNYVYLFETDSGLDPSAGKSYVDYDFSLDSGDYLETYDFDGAPGGDSGSPTEGPVNTENSTVTTSQYSERLYSRWVADQLRLKTGNAPNTDILDGDKAQVSRGCGRSEVTFSRGGGGFIANKSGPVRAIRSYIGANSGTYTQRDDIFYERRQDTNTYLRVHAGISQISQFMDYSAAATGMTYRNSAYPAGVTIDGSDDASIPTPSGSGIQPWADWQQVSGPQGSISTIARLDTDIPNVTAGFFYRDLGDGPFGNFSQCAGYADDEVFGASGSEYASSGPNTDPTLGEHNNLTSSRSLFFGAPDAGADVPELRADQVDHPLDVTATAEVDPAALAVDGGRVKKVKPGKRARLTLEVTNGGGSKATGIEACAKVSRREGRSACREVRDLGPGRSASVRLAVKTSKRAKGGIDVTYRVTADNAPTTKTKATIKLK